MMAVYILKANTLEVGIVTGLSFLPNFLIGFQAGAYVDRLSKKKIMILSQVLSALLLILLSVITITGYLNIIILYMFTFFLGCCGVFYSLAYYAYIPSIVETASLQKGNSRLELANGGVQTVGPGVGGLLIQALTVPFAILIDALSFIISIVLIWFVPNDRTIIQQTNNMPKDSIWVDVKEGIKFTFQHTILCPILISYVLSVIFIGLYQAISILYMLKVLDFSAKTIGIVIGVGNIGYILGALISNKLSKVVGLGKSVILSLGLYPIGFLIIGMAPKNHAIFWIVLGQLILSMGTPMYNVNVISLRQAITPNHLLARVGSVWRVFGRGFVPLGAVLGGVLGTFMGLRGAIIASAIGGFCALLPAIFSQLTKIKSIETASKFVVEENFNGELKT
ncbi:MFS transporter [Bacillus thuringiensis serovar medellin]|uniref:MFS transporter n=1 Tax=Bacillus thuringiensis subsp. medellin TaxID=79672 RepID=A0A9X6N3B2_BACTV|nr:MFS transporter [Bacillus thuringiensis serovar medellin]